MYKLFASDVDDTLLAIDGSLPDQTRRALQLLHENGVTVVLSSGRATASMRPIVEKVIDLDDDEYIISFNGGRVVTAKSDSVILEESISSATIEKIMEYCREHNLHMQGYTAAGFVCEEGPWTSTERAEKYGRMAELPLEYVKDMAQALPGGSVKLLGIGEHEDLLLHQKALQALTAGECTVMFSKPTYLEIVREGVSKGHALEMLAKRLGFQLSECVAMGDSLNDVEMIRRAGLGVAVGNARQELKEEADMVLERSSDEAALVELMEEIWPEIAVKL